MAILENAIASFLSKTTWVDSVRGLVCRYLLENLIANGVR